MALALAKSRSARIIYAKKITASTIKAKTLSNKPAR
jgi:hypothetical protein